jgi:hypothetical protein
MDYGLRLADAEYLCSAHWANPAGCWPLILQHNLGRFFYLPFGPAFEAIGFSHRYHLLSI